VGGTGALFDIGLPRAPPFGLLYETTPAAAGADLADLPFITGSTSGGLLRKGSIYGSGTVGADEVNGATCQAISGHPPDSDRTVLDWYLQLPPKPVRLRLHAQVRPGGGSAASSVSMQAASSSMRALLPQGLWPGTRWSFGSCDTDQVM